MKRFFVIFSNLLTACFLLWVCTLLANTLIFHYYPSVAVLESSRDISHQEVSEKLNSLSTQTDSGIIRFIQETNADGTDKDVYEAFGKQKLPENLAVASEESSQTSSLLTNYYIISGNLRPETLQAQLQKLGFHKSFVNHPSLVSTLLGFVGSGSQLLAFSLFILTYSALTVITKTRELCSAGIRLIAGQRLGFLLGKSVLSDGIELLFGAVSALLVTYLAIWLWHLPVLSAYFVTAGILVYNLLLLLVTGFFSLMYTLALHGLDLVGLIKGKVPIKSIFAIMLLGQLLAVVMVVLGLSRSVTYSRVLAQHEQGRAEWAKQAEWLSLQTSRDYGKPNDVHFQEQQEKWFHLIEDAVEYHGAMLVGHNLASFMTKDISMDGYHLTDYLPQANTLFVTPNYLEEQGIAPVEGSLNDGEFRLLLLEHLKNQETDLKKLYEDYLTQESQREMKSVVSYLQDGRERFVYNNTPMDYRQFLKDPILVVVTPRAMGAASKHFWTNRLTDTFFFKDMSVTRKLIDEYQLTKEVGSLGYSRQLYMELQGKVGVEIWIALAGAVLGLATSILLFNTMSLLYFETFRREILIKRIAGLGFWSLYQRYYCLQAVSLIAGAVVGLFLSQNLFMTVLACLLFSGNAMLVLLYRMRKERELDVLTLKGA